MVALIPPYCRRIGATPRRGGTGMPGAVGTMGGTNRDVVSVKLVQPTTRRPTTRPRATHVNYAVIDEFERVGYQTYEFIRLS